MEANIYVQHEQDELRSWFTESELQKVESIRNIVATRGRHPLVILLYTDGLNDFPRQHLANVITGLQAIRRRHPKWSIPAGWKNRLLDPDVDTCSSVLGELQVYSYLIEAFPDTKPVPTSRKQTPDFEVPHYLKKQVPAVFVEVHSKSWSTAMHSKMQSVNTNLAANPPQPGTIKTTVTIVQPFSGANGASQVEDGVSKLAGIGAKDSQFPQGHAGILWLNLEQNDLHMILKEDDCFPLNSRGRGCSCSGLIWNSLYGQKGLPLYEVYPDRPVHTMQHDGMFVRREISAVMVNFGRSIAIFENPEANVPLPDWFREQVFNVKWFSLEHSRIALPGFNLRAQIDLELNACKALRNVPTMPNW